MADPKMSEQPNEQYVVQSPPPPYSHQPQYNAPPVGVPVGVPMTAFVLTAMVGPEPMVITCPSCRHQIVTRTVRNPSTRTHVVACIFSLFLCCCVPYCVDSCNNIDHYCSNCSAYIAGYKF